MAEKSTPPLVPKSWIERNGHSSDSEDEASEEAPPCQRPTTSRKKKKKKLQEINDRSSSISDAESAAKTSSRPRAPTLRSRTVAPRHARDSESLSERSEESRCVHVAATRMSSGAFSSDKGAEPARGTLITEQPGGTREGRRETVRECRQRADPAPPPSGPQHVTKFFSRTAAAGGGRGGQARESGLGADWPSLDQSAPALSAAEVSRRRQANLKALRLEALTYTPKPDTAEDAGN